MYLFQLSLLYPFLSPDTSLLWSFLHQLRGTGALVIVSLLDFLTFGLCAPYSETTDGTLFDQLLELVAKQGRVLYRLFQVQII